MKGRYHIWGKRGAGSMIAEFLLCEVGQEYDITFMEREEIESAAFRKINPLGKVPAMVCPDGTQIFETLAIVAHLIEAFPQLAPAAGSAMRDRHWQHLAMLATSLYPAYHRQHHTRYYVGEEGFEDVRQRARAEQAPIYDYIDGIVSPYLCGDQITAADFYLYMLTRWDLDKTALREGRPKLNHFLTLIRSRETVASVIAAQKR